VSGARLGAMLRMATAELPSARGLLPLVVVLIAWQLIVRGPSPYFPAPTEW
jgi:hypothetical protein